MHNYYLYSLDIQSKDKAKELILEDIKILNLPKDTDIVISSVREPYNYEEFINLSSDIKKELLSKGYKKFTHFVHDWCSKEYLKDFVVPLHWHVLDIDFRKRYEHQKANKCWNYDSDRVLFLNMKANKVQRVGLLYKLIEQGLFDNLLYSFYPNHMLSVDNEMTTEELYKEVSGKSNFSEFVAKYANSLDIISNPLIESRSHLHIGFPYDVSLFQTTCLNLTSESLWGSDKKVFLTEKIWKAIINRQPFIIAGQPNTMSYLENLNFKTFREYLKYPDYENEKDHHLKLEKIVENVQHFLEIKSKCKEQIQKDIDHNTSQFEQLLKNERDKHYLLKNEKFYYDFLNRTKFLNAVE